MLIAVTADIVGSRALADRAASQRDIDAAIVRAHDALPVARKRFEPTVGDEQQAVFATLADAVATTTLIALALPEQLSVRFGIGIGEMVEIPAAGTTLSEGPAWWAARAAIDAVHAMAAREAPAARAWIVAADDVDDPTVPMHNAHLLLRDRVLAEMSARQRRLTFGRMLGRTQQQLAHDEQISQSAVSQSLSSAGAAELIAAHALLGEDAGAPR